MPNKTEIPWVINPDGTPGFTSNPVRGKCHHNCPYCYAETIRKRYKMPAELSFSAGELSAIKRRKKPATYFMGSMHDIFGTWVPVKWIQEIAAMTAACPQHTFLFLTKNPQRYAEVDFPLNCWLGVTLTGSGIYPWAKAYDEFLEIICTHAWQNKTFISYEPLMGPAEAILPVDWIIIGSLNKNGVVVSAEHGGTRYENANALLALAEIHNIPVFVKPELQRVYYPELRSRQEMPYLRPQ